jgi:23S rRNA pseudouridine2457 synthase
MARYKYLALNKPDGVLCTFTDPQGRDTLKNYIPVPGVYAAGRLDRDSEGLLILTNDGRIIQRLTDPDHHLPKIYLVQVEGMMTSAAADQLREGVQIPGYFTLPCKVVIIPEPNLPPRQKPITPHASPSWIQLTLYEGKKHQIRHMTSAVGFPTLRLVRIGFGSIHLGDLKPGQWRYLPQQEINSCYGSFSSQVKFPTDNLRSMNQRKVNQE